MKKTDLTRHRRTVVGGIVAVVFSATGGWLAGTSAGGSDTGETPPSPHPDKQAATTAPGSEEMRKSSALQPPAAIGRIHQRLWKIWQDTPDLDLDPEARSEMQRLVSTLSSARIEEFLRSPQGPGGIAERRFRRQIFSSWVLRDGPTALACMATCGQPATRMDRYDTDTVVTEWFRDQPDAALAWMNDATLPHQQKRWVADTRGDSLDDLMATDPDRAIQELSNMGPEDVSRQLKVWAGTYPQDPVIEKVLDHVITKGDPEEIETLRTSLVKSLAENNNHEAALEFIDSQKLDPGGRQTLERIATVARAKNEPKAAFDEWLEKNDISAGVPRSISYGIGAWIQRESDDVVKWLDEQHPGKNRDVLYADSIPAMAGTKHFDQAVKIATAIRSPDLRATALHALDLRWSLEDRDAVGKWRQELSVEDRELMGK